MNGANEGPDKRTTAYENIFGRPTAKPKGPNNAYPVAPNGAVIPSMGPVNQWVNQNAYLAGQQAPRYNGNAPPLVPQHSYRAPQQQMYGYGPQQATLPHQPPEGPDRRVSMAPSLNMLDHRIQALPAPPMSNVASAADAYGGPSDHGGYYAPPVPYARASSSSSPAPGSRPLPSIHGQYGDTQSYRHPSNAGLPPYARQPSMPAAIPPPEVSPLMTAPRLPSFDLGGSRGGTEDLWFTNGSSNGNGYEAPSVSSNGVPGPAVSPPMGRQETPVSPGTQSSTLYSESVDKDDSALGDEGMYRNGECH